jgi:hypothetical protein
MNNSLQLAINQKQRDEIDPLLFDSIHELNQEIQTPEKIKMLNNLNSHRLKHIKELDCSFATSRDSSSDKESH